MLAWAAAAASQYNAPSSWCLDGDADADERVQHSQARYAKRVIAVIGDNQEGYHAQASDIIFLFKFAAKPGEETGGKAQHDEE